MPEAYEYIVRLGAVIANQTAGERAFKAYKFTNGKLTTHSATPTASQFTSEDSETETTGTMRASLYSRLNSKTDDLSWLTDDYIIGIFFVIIIQTQPEILSLQPHENSG